MPSQQYDVTDLQSLNLPYDRRSPELDDSPRLVDGNDVMVYKGKLRKRPALRSSSFSTISFPSGRDRIGRLVIYETLENPSKIYLLASMHEVASGHWQLFTLRLGAPSPPTSWTFPTNLRKLQESDEPHEIIVSNGLAYIRGVPGSAAEDPYGTVVFDGTDESVTFWGMPAPTVAATVTTQSGWPSTTSTVVKAGWHYAYSYVTATGHVSSRSPTGAPAGQGSLSTSNTGAVTNKKPQFTFAGNSDTTNVPTIRVWRTFDGGGNYVLLEDVANPGSGTHTYTDDSYTGGRPKPDSQLNPNDLAPGTTTNDVPPPVIFPEVIGTDDPDPSSSQIVEYAGRIWFAIGNVLVFSGNEEIINGSPRESFVSGSRGNFVRFKNEIRYLEATKEALYIVTSREVLWLRGQDRKSFFIKQILDRIGGSRYKQAHTAMGEEFAFLTNDLKVALVSQGRFLGYISAPLGDDISDAINTNTDVWMASHPIDVGFWLMLGIHDRGSESNSKLWMFDTARGMWNPPWNLPVTAVASGQISESTLINQLAFATYDGTTTKITVIDLDSSQDQYTASNTTFAIDFTFNLMRNSAGNHLNALRRPAHHSRLAFVKTERTKFSSDTDPTLEYRLDDFNAAFTASTAKAPPFIHQSTSHIINWWPVVKNAQRAQVKISKSSVNEAFELQTFGLVYQPEAGA